MSQQIGDSEPAIRLGHSQPAPCSVNRTRRRRQDSRHMPYARNSRDHPSRPGPSSAAFRPQDSTMASERQSMRQNPSPVIIRDCRPVIIDDSTAVACRNLAPVDHHPPSSPVGQNDAHREPSRATHVNRGLGTDQYGPAHNELPPTYNEAVSQSREHVQREASVRPGFQAPTEAMSGQGLAMDCIRQLRQENTDLRKKLDDNNWDLERKINNLKMEQVLAVAALRDVTTEQARTIDDLKARLETRDFSEIRNEIKELRDGQKEQRELLVNMKKQLDSVQSELSQLRQAKEASTEESNVQRRHETPTLPVAADTGSGDAAQSLELGTTPSSTSQLSDFEVPAIWRTAHD